MSKDKTFTRIEVETTPGTPVPEEEKVKADETPVPTRGTVRDPNTGKLVHSAEEFEKPKETKEK